jgi:hypothetical protein
MLNDKTVREKTYENAGYFVLYNSNSTHTHANYCEYAFDSAFNCYAINRIANNNTSLDIKKGECNWEAGPSYNNRITFMTDGSGYLTILAVTLTVEHTSKNKQQWIYVDEFTNAQGDHYIKEVLYVERRNG